MSLCEWSLGVMEVICQGLWFGCIVELIELIAVAVLTFTKSIVILDWKHLKEVDAWYVELPLSFLNILRIECFHWVLESVLAAQSVIECSRHK